MAKKNLISWLIFLVASIMSVGFVSCGDDDDKLIPPSPIEEKTDFSIELSTSRQAVDLGLPSGTLWANMNVGATSNASPGGYYMWGETHEITHDYSLYVTGSGDNKYKYLGRDISGTIYDAAYVLWGEDWKMPSIEQFLELCQYCKYDKSYLSGTTGYVFVGTNGNRIFLPCGGEMDYRTLTINDSYSNLASYWSSSANLEENMESQAWSWTPGYSFKWNNSRLSGCNIRPIRNR